MKITEMMQREDFYDINRRTLKSYFEGRNCSGESPILYIYPQLNAIVTKCPSPQVRRFLLTEFNVNGNPLKRMAVRAYVLMMMRCHGLFASSKLHLDNDLSSDSLIYPCNKKYRIFDFASHTVDVITKDGFPTDDLENEISFRLTYNANFIPKIISRISNGYSEAIINGFPVARSQGDVKQYSNKAFKTWMEYTKPYSRYLSSHEYASLLMDKLEAVHKIGNDRKKSIDTERVYIIAKMLSNRIENIHESILLTLSHGDMQPGNIWVENDTGRIVIIDWESFGERSVWYDQATLYQSLRIPWKSIVFHSPFSLEKYTVIFEDLIFRFREYVNLPLDYGKEGINRYLSLITNLLT